MTNKYTKFVGLALAAVLLPVMASAATIEELQAQINALMAQLNAAKPTATASCSSVFTKTLKAGMSDSEVLALQKFLNQDSATMVASFGAGSPGNETMFFGPATKAAVVRFQNKYAAEVLAPVGLSSGTGLFGAMSRAKLNALCAAQTTTTTTTTTTTGGTTSTTGTSVSGLKGTAGSINATLTTTDTDTTVTQGMTKKVLGFKVEATDSDVNVTNVKVTLSNGETTNASSNRLPRYASTVKIYMDGTVVGQADAADFTKNNDNTYTRTIALSNAIVRMGSGNKATFHVGISANSNLDSTDASTNLWYVAASEIRYVDATGVTFNSVNAPTVTSVGNGSYASLAGTLVKSFNFQKLSTSGDVMMKISTGAANPVAQNVKVSTSAATKDIVMNEFRLKAEGSALTFNSFKLAYQGSNQLASYVDEIKLMKGGSSLGSYSVLSSDTATSGSITIKLDSDYTIAQDNTDTFDVTFSVKKNTGLIATTTNTFDQGDTAEVDYTSVNVTDVNGDNVTSGNVTGSSIGNTQTFYSAGIQASGFTSTAVSANNGTSNIPSGQTYNLSYHLKAFGNTYYIPKTAIQSTSTVASSSNGLSFNLKRAGVDVVSGVGVVIGSISSSANTVNNFFELPDGQDSVFSVAVTLNPQTASSTGISGMYSLQLNQAGYSLDQTTANVKAYTFAPTQNYQSVEANITAY